MGVQAIDQTIFPLGIWKDQSVLLPSIVDLGQIEHIGLSQYLGNNILIYCTSVYEHHNKIFYIKIAIFLLFQLFDY